MANDLPGRLTRGPYVDNTAIVYGPQSTIDNRPLWDYIDDGAALTGAPACVLARNHPRSVTLADYAAARTDLITCLQEADGIGLSIFTSDILNTHRLAHAPSVSRDGAPGEQRVLLSHQGNRSDLHRRSLGSSQPCLFHMPRRVR